MIDPDVWRGVKSERVHHVGSTALTSRRLHPGCVSRVAVLDGCRRYGLRGALSVTRDGQWCRDALPQALCPWGRPAMFPTDQGVPCTRKDCTQLRVHEGMRISMDGRGRALDHVFVERLWRTVTSEEVY